MKAQGCFEFRMHLLILDDEFVRVLYSWTIVIWQNFFLNDVKSSNKSITKSKS